MYAADGRQIGRQSPATTTPVRMVEHAGEAAPPRVAGAASAGNQNLEIQEMISLAHAHRLHKQVEVKARSRSGR